MQDTVNKVFEERSLKRVNAEHRRQGMDKPAKPGSGRNGEKEYKRYNLVLPAEVYGEIKTIADQRQTTVLEVLRKFIKLGFIVVAAEDSPNAEIIVREEGSMDKKLVLI